MAFEVKQIYDIVNNVAKQVWGSEAITATDLTGIISMGDMVLSSDTNKDKFLDTLVNRIGKTIISTRPYKGFLKNIVRDSMEYGAIVQKIYVEPFTAEANESWSKISQGDPISLGTVNKPTVRQYLFESKDVYQFVVTIPDYQLNTAFTDASALASFISAIYTSMENTIEISIENTTNMCVANFMGEKFHATTEGTAGIHTVNLLKLYNDQFSLTLSEEDAIRNADFLKFAGQTIKIYIKRLQTMSGLFNTQALKRFTNESDLNVMFISDYASANATYLESDTFHNEMVKLPNYTEVPFWQGQGTDASFQSVSSINVTTSDGHAINEDYIIGFIFDRDALGVMFNRRSSTAIYAPAQEITNKWEKLDYGFFNDLSENAIVFYLATE